MPMSASNRPSIRIGVSMRTARIVARPCASLAMVAGASGGDGASISATPAYDTMVEGDWAVATPASRIHAAVADAHKRRNACLEKA